MGIYLYHKEQRKHIEKEIKKMNYEYLLIKRAENKDGLIYDKRVFNNSKEARNASCVQLI